VLFLEPAVEVGQCTDHANGAHHRKGGGNDPVGHGSHEIATTGSHLIDQHGQGDTRLAYAVQLGGGQAIGAHQSARAFEPDGDFITTGGHAEHGIQFLPQGMDR
jgi:hypothetical protein